MPIKPSYLILDGYFSFVLLKFNGLTCINILSMPAFWTSLIFPFYCHFVQTRHGKYGFLWLNWNWIPLMNFIIVFDRTSTIWCTSYLVLILFQLFFWIVILWFPWNFLFFDTGHEKKSARPLYIAMPFLNCELTWWWSIQNSFVT